MAASLATAATTAEQQTFELLSRIRTDIAQFVTANPDKDLRGLEVIGDVDITNSIATFTVTVPIVVTEDPDGGLSVDAREVLV